MSEYEGEEEDDIKGTTTRGITEDGSTGPAEV